MQEMTLAHYWMAGVMLVMAIFAGIALHGHRLHQKRNKTSSDKK